MEDSVASHLPTGVNRRDTSHLAKQDLSTLDVSKLTPLSPEVISRQATINIGMCIIYIKEFLTSMVKSRMFSY